MAPDGQPYLFVSYASADRERVLPIIDRLEAAGVETWIDREGIHGGTNYAEVIGEAIKGAAALVLMASPASLASRNVRQELALAWRYETPYLPLLLEPVDIPDNLAYWLEGSQWIEVLDHAEHQWLADVAQALRHVGIMLQLPTGAQALPVSLRERPLLVGRDRELSLVVRRLAEAREGRGGLVLIGGEAGIGKTALADTVLATAQEQGFLVLEGHCFDLAETPPYGPWIDLFAHAPQALTTPLPEAFAVRGTVGAVPHQMALFTQVEAFLQALTARQPVALLLDDLHWSDPASLDLLRYLARSVATLPLLILITYRSDELTRRHPLYALLPQLSREAGAVRLDLGRLGDQAVQELVATRYGLADADTVRLSAHLQDLAEGNALFVGELLRALEETGELHQVDGRWQVGNLSAQVVPPVLREVIGSRVARLDEESQRLLGIAAVIGQTVPLQLWAMIGEVDEAVVLDLAERADEARHLEGTADGAGVRFAHALIREALYEGVPSLRRRRLHRQIGETLATSEAPNPDLVAYHFQQAGDPQAVPWLIKAGERAQRAYAWVTAVDRFEAALARMTERDAPVVERAILLFRIAFLLRSIDERRALRDLEEARSWALAAGEAGLASRCLHLAGLLRCFIGDPRQGILTMEQASREFRALSPAEQERMRAFVGADLGPAEGTLALWLAHVGRFAEAQTWARRVLAESPPRLEVGQGDSWYADAAFGLAYAEAALGRPTAARAALQQARSIFRTIAHHRLTAVCCVAELAWVQLPYFTEEHAVSARLVEEAEEAERQASESAPFTRGGATLALQFLSSDWQPAQEIADRSGHSQRWIGRTNAQPWRAMLAYHRGDLYLARSVIDEVLPDGPSTEPGSTISWCAWALQRLAAAMALDAGDLTNAHAWLEAHDRWLDWSAAVLGRAEGALLWAQYHHANGEPDLAHQQAEQALAHASEPRQPLALIATERFLGHLDTEAGYFDAADARLQESLKLANACQAPFERALTLLGMAELRMAQGKPDEAHKLLAEVRRICALLAARPTLERVARLEARLVAGGDS